MKKFAFRLETVLKYRLRLEEQAEREFAKAASKVQEQNEVIRGYINAEEQAKNDLRDMQQQGMNMAQIRLQTGYLSALGRKIRRAYIDLEDLTQFQELRRRDLIEARKQRRALEILREKKEKAYMLEVAREEQKVLDEIAGRARGEAS